MTILEPETKSVWLQIVLARLIPVVSLKTKARETSKLNDQMESVTYSYIPAIDLACGGIP